MSSSFSDRQPMTTRGVQRARSPEPSPDSARFDRPPSTLNQGNSRETDGTVGVSYPSREAGTLLSFSPCAAHDNGGGSALYPIASARTAAACAANGIHLRK